MTEYTLRNDMATCTWGGSLRILSSDEPVNCPTITAGALVQFLKKFRKDQPVYLQGDDGELVDIGYAELHDYSKRK